MNPLTSKHFPFMCPMNWDDMEVSPNGRFCTQCRKEVFDLTNCSLDEVAALQRKHGAICGSIRVAVVAASLTAAACQNTPGERLGGVVLPVQTDAKDVLLGTIQVQEPEKKNPEY